MYRLEKDGLIRETASLEAAQAYIRQGFALKEQEPRPQTARRTVEQLIAECRELGIEIPADARKADLIDLLAQHTAGAAGD